MTKFIKLTERYNNKLKPIVISVDNIASFKLGNGGTDTMIQIKSGENNKYYFVKETVDEVWEMVK